MILELLWNVIFYSFELLLLAVPTIPTMPESVFTFMDYAKPYIIAGGGVLANYTDYGYLLSLFGIILVIDLVIALYHFIMWVIRKFPVASE